MSKNNSKGRFGLIMVVILAILMTTLTGCGKVAGSSSWANQENQYAAEALEQDTVMSSTAVAAPTANKPAVSTSTEAATYGSSKHF